jgi:hypothetical protein
MKRLAYKPPRECICQGTDGPRCHVCLCAQVVGLIVQHPNGVSVGLVRQKVPELTGREIALLLEARRYFRW